MKAFDISQLNKNPQQLFLVDAVGALISAVLLGLVLTRFYDFFGIPIHALHILAIIPCFFILYDVVSYFQSRELSATLLKGIAFFNVTYCVFSLIMAFLHRETITIFGWMYIMGEVFVVLVLVGVELKVARREE